MAAPTLAARALDPRSGVVHVKLRVTRLRVLALMLCTQALSSTTASHIIVPSSNRVWNGWLSAGSWYTMHAFV
jgi:hypothetical protein